MTPSRLAVAVLCTWLPAAFAQHSGAAHHEHGAATPARHAHGPYAGMQGRAIKALSEQQLSDLRAGKGMSLELSEPLKLTAEQKSRTQSLFVQMQQEAKLAGEEVIVAEAALDALFKTKSATPGALRAATHNAAVAQGQLRETHLRYHLAMVELLSPEQVAVYNRLRGY